MLPGYYSCKDHHPSHLFPHLLKTCTHFILYFLSIFLSLLPLFCQNLPPFHFSFTFKIVVEALIQICIHSSSHNSFCNCSCRYSWTAKKGDSDGIWGFIVIFPRNCVHIIIKLYNSVYLCNLCTEKKGLNARAGYTRMSSDGPLASVVLNGFVDISTKLRQPIPGGVKRG